jgi:hypothetical protein
LGASPSPSPSPSQRPTTFAAAASSISPSRTPTPSSNPTPPPSYRDAHLRAAAQRTTAASAAAAPKSAPAKQLHQSTSSSSTGSNASRTALAQPKPSKPVASTAHQSKPRALQHMYSDDESDGERDSPALTRRQQQAKAEEEEEGAGGGGGDSDDGADVRSGRVLPRKKHKHQRNASSSSSGTTTPRGKPLRRSNSKSSFTSPYAQYAYDDAISPLKVGAAGGGSAGSNALAASLSRLSGEVVYWSRSYSKQLEQRARLHQQLLRANPHHRLLQQIEFARVWSDQSVRKINQALGRVYGVCIGKKLIVAGSTSGRVMVYERSTLKPHLSLLLVTCPTAFFDVACHPSHSFVDGDYSTSRGFEQSLALSYLTTTMSCFCRAVILMTLAFKLLNCHRFGSLFGLIACFLIACVCCCALQGKKLRTIDASQSMSPLPSPIASPPSAAAAARKHKGVNTSAGSGGAGSATGSGSGGSGGSGSGSGGVGPSSRSVVEQKILDMVK